MKLALSSILLCFGVACGSKHLRRAAQETAEEVFLEQGSLVVMEAESVDVVWPWMMESDVDEYTGSGYFRFDGNTVETGPPNGTLSYKFFIETPGDYRMLLRANKDNNDNTLSNDCYTRLVDHEWPYGETIKTYLPGPPNEWSYDTLLEVAHDDKRVARYNFQTPGVYELQVNGRSKNYYVDRIVLFDESVLSFDEAANAALPESSRGVPSYSNLEPPNRISGLELVMAGESDGSVLRNVVDGDVIDLSQTGTSLSMVAQTNASVAYVTFAYDEIVWTEYGAPYTMAGDANGIYTEVNYLQTTGAKTIVVSAFSGTGSSLGNFTANFEIVDEENTPNIFGTLAPSSSPMASQTKSPTVLVSTKAPTRPPVAEPTNAPVIASTDSPIVSPTDSPIVSPTDSPTVSPTDSPVVSPTDAPVVSPSHSPIVSPTDSPSIPPIARPATESPSLTVLSIEPVCNDECGFLFGLFPGYTVSRTWFGSFCTERCLPKFMGTSDVALAGYTCGTCSD